MTVPADPDSTARNLATQGLKRVLVALDPAAECRAALETAARLAAQWEAELVGLFVEESELLEAAALPVAQVIRGSDFTLERLDRHAMERGLKAWAAQAEAHLAAAAERWRVQASFRVARGNLAEALLAEARRSDLLALGTVGRVSQRGRIGATARLMARQAPCSVLVMRRDKAVGLPVVVVFEGGERALAFGAELAGLQGRGLEIVAANADLLAVAQAWLERHDLRAAVEQAAATEADRLSGLLGSRAAGIVVLERAGPLGGAIDTDRVLAGPPSSVVLVG